MKLDIEVITTKTVDAKWITVTAPLYDGEKWGDLFGRTGSMWRVKVDVDTGKIEGWPQGDMAHVYIKAVDRGDYRLLDADGRELARLDEQYVPGCIPGEHGDYIDFDIDVDGSVLEWRNFCSASNINEAFFDAG